MFESIWFWSSCALLIFWVLGARRRLLRLRARAIDSYTRLMSQMAKQTELALTAVSEAATHPEPHRDSSAVLHIAACWRRLSATSTDASIALVRMQQNCLDQQLSRDLSLAWQAFNSVWDELRVSPWRLLSESMPQQWHENQLLGQPLRHSFNQAVQDYNHAITQWPASMVARVLNLTLAQELSLPSDPVAGESKKQSSHE